MINLESILSKKPILNKLSKQNLINRLELAEEEILVIHNYLDKLGSPIIKSTGKLSICGRIVELLKLQQQDFYERHIDQNSP